MRSAWWLAVAGLAVALLGAPCFGADPYPSKPVKVIVPFGTGSAVDLTARVIAQQLSEQLGKPFVVENRPGASGTIADAMVAKSPPDGYTLMAMDTSTTIVPGLYKALPFDVAKDFTPISQIVAAPMALVVNPSLNVSTLKEFVALAQANPGKFNYSSAGPGTPIHLATELFKASAKVDIKHIPYKGGGDMVAAVLAGNVQMLLTTITNVSPNVAAGKLRGLAVTTSGKRSPAMPDVPTMAEAGMPDMVVYTWFGLVGPPDMPKEIVNLLHAEIVRAIAVPAVREVFAKQGAELVGSTPEEFGRHIARELQRWAEVVKVAGITPE